VKTIVALAAAAGAVLLLRRQRDRPAKEVWRDATSPSTS
jgi:hypothetical protein